MKPQNIACLQASYLSPHYTTPPLNMRGGRSGLYGGTLTKIWRIALTSVSLSQRCFPADCHVATKSVAPRNDIIEYGKLIVATTTQAFQTTYQSPPTKPLGKKMSTENLVASGAAGKFRLSKLCCSERREPSGRFSVTLDCLMAFTANSSTTRQR